MHDNWGGGKAGGLYLVANAFDDVEVKRLLSFEFVGAVTGADRGRERVTLCLLDELDSFVRVGQASVSFIHLNVFLDAAEPAELGFDADAFGMRFINDALGDGNVFVEVRVAGI